MLINENDVEIIETIGIGLSGEIFKVKIGDEFYALKSYNKNKFLFSEINSLARCDHPNVIKYITTGMYDGRKSIITELGIESLNIKREISNSEKKSYFFQILCGMQHIMNNNIIISDLKPENIVRFEDGRVALIDMGSSSVNTCSVNINIVDKAAYTWRYIPPEVLYGHYYNEKSELWTIGVTMHRIETGKFLFKRSTTKEGMIKNIFGKLGEPNKSTVRNIKYKKLFDKVKFSENPLLDDLIRKFVVINPKNRITIDEALDHPYFKGVKIPRDITIRERPLSCKQKLLRHQYIPQGRYPLSKQYIKSCLNLLQVDGYYKKNFKPSNIVYALQLIDRWFSINNGDVDEIVIKILFMLSKQFKDAIVGLNKPSNFGLNKFSNNYEEKKILGDISNLTENYETLIFEILRGFNGVIMLSTSNDFVRYYGKKYNKEIKNSAHKKCVKLAIMNSAGGTYSSEILGLLALKLACKDFGVDFEYDGKVKHIEGDNAEIFFKEYKEVSDNLEIFKSYKNV